MLLATCVIVAFLSCLTARGQIPTTQCQCSTIVQCITTQAQQRATIRSACITRCGQAAAPLGTEGAQAGQCDVSYFQTQDQLNLLDQQCFLNSGQQCVGATAVPPAPTTTTTTTGGRASEWQISNISPVYRYYKQCLNSCTRSNGTSIPAPPTTTNVVNPLVNPVNSIPSFQVANGQNSANPWSGFFNGGRRKRGGFGGRGGGGGYGGRGGGTRSCATQNNCYLSFNWQNQWSSSRTCYTLTAAQRSAQQLAKCQCLVTALGLSTTQVSCTSPTVGGFFWWRWIFQRWRK